MVVWPGEGRNVDCTPLIAERDNVITFETGYGAMANALIVMAKYWQPGQVKTRLAAKIGFDAAASLHELFTRRLAQSLDQVGDCRQMRVAPDTRCGEMADAISSNWTIAVQRDGDLGRRMWRGFSDCFAAGATRVVMIGADLPTLGHADIELAFEHLDCCDVVIGPAVDGGYYLIGLNRGHQEIDRFLSLFGTLSWGTSSVFTDTLSIAQRVGLTVRQLPEREDVDHWADLVRLVQRLERSDSSDDTALALAIRARIQHVSLVD